MTSNRSRHRGPLRRPRLPMWLLALAGLLLAAGAAGCKKNKTGAKKSKRGSAQKPAGRRVVVGLYRTSQRMLPYSSTARLSLPHTTHIGITQSDVRLNRRKLFTLEQRRVPTALLSSPTSFLIMPLWKELQREAKRKQQHHKRQGTQNAWDAVLLADRDSPYKLLTRVMYTSGQAVLHNIQIAVCSQPDHMPCKPRSLPLTTPRLGGRPVSHLKQCVRVSTKSVVRKLGRLGRIKSRGTDTRITDALNSALGAPPRRRRTKPKPAARRPRPRATPRAKGPLDLRLALKPKGVYVWAEGHQIPKGCDLKAWLSSTQENLPTPTLARAAVGADKGAYRFDVAALSACLKKLHKRHPNALKAHLSATPKVPLSAYVRAMDALRGEGKSLRFPCIVPDAL